MRVWKKLFKLNLISVFYINEANHEAIHLIKIECQKRRARQYCSDNDQVNFPSFILMYKTRELPIKLIISSHEENVRVNAMKSNKEVDLSVELWWLVNSWLILLNWLNFSD